MYIDAKSARCWKYSPTDTHIHFPPGSTFQPNRTAVATGLSFINTLCTRSECNLPILMENNKNHQITLPKGRIGFSSLDVVDRDEPKYQIRSPYELTNAIISTDERYNDCFLLHSTVPAQNSDDFLQIIYGTEDSILQQPNSIGHCISADARMGKGFADFLSHRIAACCYFGVDLGNGLEHNSLSRSADGTPYSSSDLLTLLLPFTWTKLF